MKKMTSARPRSPRRSFSEIAVPPFAHEKARLVPGFSVAVAAYFLKLRAPKRCLNLSMRPPVSSTFCVPV